MDVATFVILLSFGIPGVFLLAAKVAGKIHNSIAKPARLSLLFLLSTAMFLIGSSFIESWPFQLGASILLAALILWGYANKPLVQSCFNYLIPLVLIIPVLFLMNSSIKKIVIEKQIVNRQIHIHSKISVILVVFDELPLFSLLDQNQKIDSNLYPHFAELARGSSWYANATTVGDGTPTAIPAILTGQYPAALQLPIIYDHPQNLFTLLNGSYELNVMERVSRLCPKESYKGNQDENLVKRMGSILSDLSLVYLHLVTPSGLRIHLPPIGNAWGNFWKGGNPGGSATAANRAEEFRTFVNQISDSQKPTLYYLHSLLPHDPWEFLPSGKREECNWDEKDGRNNRLRCHLLQVGFTDVLMGELIQKLKQTGLYDRSLLIVTADHGRSFDSHTAPRAVRKDNYSDQMLIPLFIKNPFQKNGSISYRNVETIDILPTIADFLDVSIDWPDGVSVLDSTAPERNKKWLYSRKSQSLISFEPRMEIDAETMGMKAALQR